MAAREPSSPRPVTIHDVAARARVSKSTVSNVVRGVPNVRPALRVKVEQAIAELGYTPSAVARSLVARRTRTLGVTIPRLEPFYADVLHGAETAGCPRRLPPPDR